MLAHLPVRFLLPSSNSARSRLANLACGGAPSQQNTRRSYTSASPKVPALRCYRRCLFGWHHSVNRHAQRQSESQRNEQYPRLRSYCLPESANGLARYAKKRSKPWTRIASPKRARNALTANPQYRSLQRLTNFHNFKALLSSPPLE